MILVCQIGQLTLILVMSITGLLFFSKKGSRTKEKMN